MLAGDLFMQYDRMLAKGKGRWYNEGLTSVEPPLVHRPENVAADVYLVQVIMGPNTKPAL